MVKSFPLDCRPLVWRNTGEYLTTITIILVENFSVPTYENLVGFLDVKSLMCRDYLKLGYFLLLQFSIRPL